MDAPTQALANVGRQAADIRNNFAQHIDAELRMNINPSWPELLNGFQQVARQLYDLTEDIDPVLELFALQPVRPTATPSHIALFLSTRPLAEMDSADQAELAQAEQQRQEENESDGDLLDAVEAHNDRMLQLEHEYATGTQEIFKASVADVKPQLNNSADSMAV